MNAFWTPDPDQPLASGFGIHLGLTAIMAWLAGYLELSHDVFAVECGFSYMAHFGSEHRWAVLFLAAANVGVIGMISSNSAIRLISVLIVASVHGVFAGFLLLSNVSAWSGTYAIIAVMGYYLAYRQTRAGLHHLRRAVVQAPSGGTHG